MQQGAESEPVQAYLSEFLSWSEFLSKIGTHLLASSDIIEKNRNPLACLRNAGSYFAVTYCITFPAKHGLSMLVLGKIATAPLQRFLGTGLTPLAL